MIGMNRPRRCYSIRLLLESLLLEYRWICDRERGRDLAGGEQQIGWPLDFTGVPCVVWLRQAAGGVLAKSALVSVGLVGDRQPQYQRRNRIQRNLLATNFRWGIPKTFMALPPNIGIVHQSESGVSCGRLTLRLYLKRQSSNFPSPSQLVAVVSTA